MSEVPAVYYTTAEVAELFRKSVPWVLEQRRKCMNEDEDCILKVLPIDIGGRYCYYKEEIDAEVRRLQHVPRRPVKRMGPRKPRNWRSRYEQAPSHVLSAVLILYIGFDNVSTMI